MKISAFSPLLCDIVTLSDKKLCLKKRALKGADLCAVFSELLDKCKNLDFCSDIYLKKIISIATNPALFWAWRWLLSSKDLHMPDLFYFYVFIADSWAKTLIFWVNETHCTYTKHLIRIVIFPMITSKCGSCAIAGIVSNYLNILLFRCQT